jgi:hypothetical protein
VARPTTGRWAGRWLAAAIGGRCARIRVIVGFDECIFDDLIDMTSGSSA